MKEDWATDELGNIFHTSSGGTPSRRNDNYFKGSILWVKSGELDKGVIFNTEEKISEEAVKNSSAKIFPKGTLLIALYGATIGKLAFLGVDAATNQAICGIYKNDNIDSKFLYNFLLFRRPKLISQGAGGAQPNISQTILKKLEFSFPSKPEQRAIVQKIENLFALLDKGIADLKTAQEQLKIYRQAVLKKAFEGEFIFSTPEDWEYQPFKECLKFSQGIQVDVKLQSETKKDNQVRFLRIIDFTQGNEPERYIENPGEKYIVKKEDISLVRYGASTGFVCTGKEGAIANNLFQVIPLKQIKKSYLFYFLNSPLFQNVISQSVKGAAMPAISFGLINNVILPFPKTIDEQHTIVREIESRLSVCDKVEQSISESLKKAEALRQCILKNAFEGKLLSQEEITKCKQEADYEPASVLLERIRKENKHGK